MSNVRIHVLLRVPVWSVTLLFLHLVAVTFVSGYDASAPVRGAGTPVEVALPAMLVVAASALVLASVLYVYWRVFISGTRALYSARRTPAEIRAGVVTANRAMLGARIVDIVAAHVLSMHGVYYACFLLGGRFYGTGESLFFTGLAPDVDAWTAYWAILATTFGITYGVGTLAVALTAHPLVSIAASIQMLLSWISIGVAIAFVASDVIGDVDSALDEGGAKRSY